LGDYSTEALAKQVALTIIALDAVLPESRLSYLELSISVESHFVEVITTRSQRLAETVSSHG
jgi:hypothetical protein